MKGRVIDAAAYTAVFGDDRLRLKTRDRVVLTRRFDFVVQSVVAFVVRLGLLPSLNSDCRLSRRVSRSRVGERSAPWSGVFEKIEVRLAWTGPSNEAWVEVVDRAESDRNVDSRLVLFSSGVVIAATDDSGVEANDTAVGLLPA